MGHNRSFGSRGEEAAARYLEGLGYEILGRNVRKGRCELDIIARDGNALVFVEVKTRSNRVYGQPGEAVTPAKQQHIVKAALLYMQEMELWKWTPRFDVMEVLGQEDAVLAVRHIPHAFECSGSEFFY